MADFAQVWDAINDGTIYSCPSLLASFTVLCFADLKKYKFTYLFGFPALHSDPLWRSLPRTKADATNEDELNQDEDLVIHMTGQETAALVDCVQTWRYRVDPRQHGFFLARKQQRESMQMSSRDSGGSESENPSGRPTTPGTPGDVTGFSWSVGSLIEFERGFFDGVPLEDRFVCFVDPSTYPTYPGWMLRNLLVLVRRRWELEKVQVLCYRDVQGRRDAAKSIIFSLGLSDTQSGSSSFQGPLLSPSDMPKVTGWERNKEGKIASRVANLGEYMDPQR